MLHAFLAKDANLNIRCDLKQATLFGTIIQINQARNHALGHPEVLYCMQNPIFFLIHVSIGRGEHSLLLLIPEDSVSHKAPVHSDQSYIFLYYEISMNYIRDRCTSYLLLQWSLTTLPTGAQPTDSSGRPPSIDTRPATQENPTQIRNGTGLRDSCLLMPIGASKRHAPK